MAESLALHRLDEDPPDQYLIAVCDDCQQEFVRRFASYEQRTPDHPKFYAAYSRVCGACARTNAGNKHLRMANAAFKAAKIKRAAQIRGLAKAKAAGMAAAAPKAVHTIVPQLARPDDENAS